MLWMLWIQTRAHRIHVVRKIVFHHICCLCLVCRLHWRFIDPNPAKFSSIFPALLILLLFAWHKVLYYFYWCFLYDICRYAVERTAYTLGASPNKTMSHVFYGRRQELVRLRDSWFVNAGVARFFFTLVDLFLNLRYFMQFEAFKWKSFHFCFDLYLSFIFSEKRFPCLSSFCRQQRSKKRNISRAGVRMSRVLCEHRFSLSIVICSIFFCPFTFASALAFSMCQHCILLLMRCATLGDAPNSRQSGFKSKKMRNTCLLVSLVSCSNVLRQVCDHVHLNEDIFSKFGCANAANTQIDRCSCWRGRKREWERNILSLANRREPPCMANLKCQTQQMMETRYFT